MIADTLPELLLGQTNPTGKVPMVDSAWRGFDLRRVATLEPSAQALYSGTNTTIAADNAAANVIQAKLSAALSGNAATLANPTTPPLDQSPLLFRIDNQSGADVALSLGNGYVLFSDVGTAPLTLSNGKVTFLVARYSVLRSKYEIIGFVRE